MAKVLEYKSMLSGWKIIREIPIEGNDLEWVAVGRRNYNEVRVRLVSRKDVMK